jgi:chromosome segregation and condensation protein ScpB
MRQPISRAEIEEMRMVQLNVTILHDLQDYGWVKVVKVTSNDTHLYGTTLKFLQEFGLSSISEFEKMSLEVNETN